MIEARITYFGGSYAIEKTLTNHFISPEEAIAWIREHTDKNTTNWSIGGSIK